LGGLPALWNVGQDLARDPLDSLGAPAFVGPCCGPAASDPTLRRRSRRLRSIAANLVATGQRKRATGMQLGGRTESSHQNSEQEKGET